VASADAGVLPEPGAQIRLDGRLVTVVAATPTASGADLVIRRGDGTLADAVLTRAELEQGSVPENDGQGDASKALAGLWARWMQTARRASVSCRSATSLAVGRPEARGRLARGTQPRREPGRARRCHAPGRLPDRGAPLQPERQRLRALR
jgi:hypothetical protein